MANDERLQDEFMQQLKAVIEKHMDEADFSIAQLCQEMGISRAQLHRRLKSATGLSASHYLRKVRLEKAKTLLDSTELNISEIGYKIGFSSPQNFSKYFIEAYGLSPSAYRKNQQPSPTTPEEPQPEKPARHFWRIIWWSLPLVALAIVLLLQQYNSDKQAPVPPRPSIAVLPFDNIGSPENEFLCEGMVENILTHLARFENLRVISRTSSSRFKNRASSISQIAAELGVDYILEGSVRQEGEQLRITAQLIQTTDDKHVWAKSYDRSRTNIMEIESILAQEIARSLNQTISPKLARRLEQQPTANTQAYNALLRGRHLMRTRTQEGLQASIQEFDRALQLDSTFSQAFAEKATAYILLADLGYAANQQNLLRQAEKFVLLAIKADANNAQAYATLGTIYREQYRWQEALTSYSIALDINPGHALTNYWLSLTHRAIGELTPALEYNRLAHELDPLHPVIFTGYVYTAALDQQFDLAAQLLQDNRAVFQSSFLYPVAEGLYHFCRNECEQAISAIETALEINPSFRIIQSRAIFCLGQLDQKEEVQAYLDTLDVTQATDCISAAIAHLGLGQPEPALYYLQQAASKGLLPKDLPVNPLFTALHNDPVFEQLLAAYGLPLTD